MEKIVLLSDSVKQNEGFMKARDIFSSSLFKKAYEFALSIEPKNIFIISSEYGLITGNDMIYSYIKNPIQIDEKIDMVKILKVLTTHTNLIQDEFILLSNNRHNKKILPWINNYLIPLQKLCYNEKVIKLNNLILKEKLNKIKDRKII